MRNMLSMAALASAVALAGAQAAQAQVSDDLVKIGVLTDLSGIYSDLAGFGSITAAEMAIKDYGGTVLGKPIQLVSADSQNKPDIGSAIARQWIAQEKVDVLVDLVPTTVALAVMELARQENRISLVVGSASTPITNEHCTETNVHWMYDTYSSSVGTGRALIDQGYDTWFFLTADYAFGKALEEDVTNVIKEGNGTVVGSVRHPLNTLDFSSFLLQAQASGAEVIGLANAGGDAVNAVKQAGEFGITATGQIVAPLLMFLSDIHSIGLEDAQGLFLTEGFYWDYNDETRAWSQRFFEQRDSMPTMAHAGVYSAVTHYLKSVEAAGTDDTQAVMAKMREMPVNDVVISNGKIREDGRLVHDMYLFQVKSPEESTRPWDYYNVKAVIPGDQAFKPLSESTCPLVNK